LEAVVPGRNRFTIAGKDLVETVKQLISRRDTRRVCLMQEEKRLLEIPRIVGDPAAPATALAAPVLAALNAFATLVTECTIEVEKADEPQKEATK
jgi:hypothetical protein